MCNPALMASSAPPAFPPQEPSQPAFALPPNWSNQDEAAFQQSFQTPGPRAAWLSDFAYDDRPDPAGPSDYNYRLAHREGVQPAPYAPDEGRHHWPSVAPSGAPLKAPDHPTAWMEHFMQRYGVDPNTAAPNVIARGRQDRIVPDGWSR